MLGWPLLDRQRLTRIEPEASADTWTEQRYPLGTRARDPRRGLAISERRLRQPARTPPHNLRRAPFQARAPYWRSPWRRLYSRRTLPTRPCPPRTTLHVRADPSAARSRRGLQTSVSRLAGGRREPGRAPPDAESCLQQRS